MKKLIFIFFLGFTLNSFSQVVNNNGATIFTVNPSVIILNDMNLTNNNNGEIKIKSNSSLIIDENLTNNTGNIEISGNSNVLVKKDVINYATFNNKELSTTRVLGNFINHAFILNEAIIEMGE